MEEEEDEGKITNREVVCSYVFQRLKFWFGDVRKKWFFKKNLEPYRTIPDNLMQKIRKCINKGFKWEDQYEEILGEVEFQQSDAAFRTDLEDYFDDEIFSDSRVSWARVLYVLALAATFAIKSYDKNNKRRILLIVDGCTEVLDGDVVRPWLERMRGWEQFRGYDTKAEFRELSVKSRATVESPVYFLLVMAFALVINWLYDNTINWKPKVKGLKFK